MALAVRPGSSPTLKDLPADSLLHLYDPATWGNSFSLDGFPSLKDGEGWQSRLAGYIERGILGMTTNQTLFRTLIETGALDGRLQEFKRQGRSGPEVYRILYNEATTEAARLFAPVHARWPWEGRVSQEASALLTELEPLVREVRRIAGAMQGTGSFTKIPNIPIGPQAVRAAVASGEVQPNITLVFSDLHYLDTVDGYLRGLEELARTGKDLSGIHSVNSLFVSRVDRVADPMIDERLKRAGSPAEQERLRLLRGKIAVAQAKIVYRIFSAIFLGEPFRDPQGLYADEQGQQMLRRIGAMRALFAQLKGQGANPQRLLIASTGVKSDQPYSPLLYVLPFLGPWTVNTLPEGTLDQLIRFVSGRREAELDSLKGRNLMAEPLPALPTDVQPIARWDEAVLVTREQRARAGVGELSPDEILHDAQALVFQPAGTTLRALCDTLRDKGAASFTSDEQATLQALQAKLDRL